MGGHFVRPGKEYSQPRHSRRLAQSRGRIRLESGADSRRHPQGLWRAAIPGAGTYRRTPAHARIHTSFWTSACHQPQKGQPTRDSATCKANAAANASKRIVTIRPGLKKTSAALARRAKCFPSFSEKRRRRSCCALAVAQRRGRRERPSRCDCLPRYSRVGKPAVPAGRHGWYECCPV